MILRRAGQARGGPPQTYILSRLMAVASLDLGNEGLTTEMHCHQMALMRPGLLMENGLC